MPRFKKTNKQRYCDLRYWDPKANSWRNSRYFCQPFCSIQISFVEHSFQVPVNTQLKMQFVVQVKVINFWEPHYWWPQMKNQARVFLLVRAGSCCSKGWVFWMGLLESEVVFMRNSTAHLCSTSRELNSADWYFLDGYEINMHTDTAPRAAGHSLLTLPCPSLGECYYSMYITYTGMPTLNHFCLASSLIWLGLRSRTDDLFLGI